MSAFPPSRMHPPTARRSTRAAVAWLAAACVPLVVGSTTAMAASTAPGCAPPGPPLSKTITQDTRADGTSEITEYLPRGEYRVTRCGRNGRFAVSQTVSPIIDPDGGVTLVTTQRQEPGVVMEALYGDPTERSWAESFRAARAAARAQVIPPTVPSPTAPAAVPSTLPADPSSMTQAKEGPAATADEGLSARAAVAGDACSNAQFSLWQGGWTSRNYGYHINRSRFNYNDNTVTSLITAHTNWDRSANSCGLADITHLASWHLGSTASTIHTYPDGASVVDRGTMSSVGCAGALACTYVFTDGAGTIVETDQRYSDAITFSNVGAAGAYDYQAVGTHESGHGVGLGHANSSDALTMFYAVRAGTTHPRSLAKGDVMGLRTRYP